MLLEFRIRFMNLMFEISIVTGCFERESLKKSMIFFFSIPNFREELQRLHDNGILTRLIVCFSRENMPPEAKYVQVFALFKIMETADTLHLHSVASFALIFFNLML